MNRVRTQISAGLLALGGALTCFSGFAQGGATPIEVQRAGTRPTYEQPVAVDAKNYESVQMPLKVAEGERVVFIGNGLAERMMHFSHFEALLHSSFSGSNITFRNMGFPGHTPAFRPEPGLEDPWAFEGGDKFRPEINDHLGIGHYPKPDEWLTILDADTVVGFFGFNESFDGMEGVANFKAEVTAFVEHTKGQAYNGVKAPRIVLASPIAMEQHPDFELPNAGERNAILAAYAKAMESVAKEQEVGFIDLYTPTAKAFRNSAKSPLTINGIHLNDEGYEKLAPHLFEKMFGNKPAEKGNLNLLKKAIADKSWMWKNDYRMLNGVHAWGRRWAPYGNFNYPEEIEKIRQMTVLRDANIWEIAQGKSSSIEVDDSSTRPLTEVETNYYVPGASEGKKGSTTYLEEQEALKKFTLPEGYEISVFATEVDFPNLKNPAQMQFDNKGRLWVSVIPSYPHYRPGDELPNDKILIYEDTDGDGRADKEIVFADNLHVPLGFEISDNGVYVSEEPYLTLHQDTDGDGRSDKKDYILDGFDSHDTHHAISSFESDNAGGLFMCEGRFLHSQVETPWGPERMTDGGAWRFDPHSWKLERVMQSDVSNPWGVAHDEYGQTILNDASGGAQWWMLAYSMKVPHAYEIPKVEMFNYEHKVRPTVGSGFIHSSHFPDEVQGDYIYSNTIGFLGIKQFQVTDRGTPLRSKHRQDLIQSTDPNFRPADLEFGPDGSLYFLDWHSVLIGHMQHSARDPLRAPTHGRIYRITYPSRPLAEIPEIAGASIKQLFENMKLPELQNRRRSHRELRGHDANKVVKYAESFAKENASDERLVLEAFWATWAQQKPSVQILDTLMKASDHRVRAGAMRVVRHCLTLLDNPEEYLYKAAADSHGRVRLEAISAASWLGGEAGARTLLIAASQTTDKWINNGLNSAMLLLKEEAEKLIASGEFKASSIPQSDLLLTSKLKVNDDEAGFLSKGVSLKGRENKVLKEAYSLGKNVFSEDGSCKTCHQDTGLGLPNVYPPLVTSEWVTGDKDRLIKLILHGLYGEIEVNGVTYDPAKGVPPMTAFGGMLSDNEVAAVATYVRNSWGNKADIVHPSEVKKVREATKGQVGFLSPAELLKEHPMTEKN